MDFKDIKKTIKPWVYLATFIIIFSATVFNFKTVFGTLLQFIMLFKPLYYGIAIAYVLNLPMKKIENFLKKHVKKESFFYSKLRGISVLLTLIGTIILIILLVSVIIPKLASSAALLFNNLEVYLTTLIQYVNRLLDYFNIDYDVSSAYFIQYFDNLKWDDVIKNVGIWLTTGATSVISTSMNFIGSFATWFSAFILSLYLLTAKETYIIQLKKVIAAIFSNKQTEYIFKIGKKANHIFSGFIGGQLLEAIILGFLCYVTMLLFKFPFPELIATLVGITSLVPMFGAMFGMAFGCVLIFAINPLQSIWFIIYFQILQQLENNLIYPRVVGGSVGISGIYVLLSLLIFGALFGLIGMLIAVPVTALLYTVTSETVHAILDKKNVHVDENNYYIKENKD